MPSKRTYRVAFLALLVVSSGFLLNGYLTSTARGGEAELAAQAELPAGERDAVAAERDGMTVITTSSRPGSQAELVAFNPNGTVAYYNSSFRKFFDVDPVPGTERTVEYVATKNLPKAKCPIEAAREECILNTVVRVNVSTGTETTVYKHVTHKDWHDVDRLGPDRLLVADIAEDRVFVVNTTSGMQHLAWDAQADFPIKGGGFYPSDWTHMNDVERLDDGRTMVGLRNQDQVVFLHPEQGLQEEWTLGSENDHEILYEQHNPDYIPASEGGPAVLVADSENGRVIEYQRTDEGTWNASWAWADSELQWPRDADRLPNGHTLITDSNGNRVLEIDQAGDVVWSVSVDTPYEAERLNTPDESEGGEAAQQVGLDSRGDTAAVDATAEDEQRHTNPSRQLWNLIKGLVPSLVVNGVVFIMPAWVGFRDVLTVVGMGTIGVVWAAAEFRWSAWEIQSPLRRN